MNRARLLSGQLCLALLACSSPDPVGRYGQYGDHTQRLVLDSGDSLKVLRVKLWTFKDGTSPALQLEYEATGAVIDSSHAFTFAKKIWPAFAPYVQAVEVRNAIITATVLDIRHAPLVQTSLMQHFGIVLMQNSNGYWHFRGHPDSLPPLGLSTRKRLTSRNGVPLSPKEFAAMILAERDSA